MSNLERLKDIKRALNHKFIEREKEVEAMLIALLSRQHMLMIGPAGTAKSALSAELSSIIAGSTYFQWLLTRFSTPEEVFGPLSLKDLENGIYKRNTAGKMPEAHIAFIDETFKGNSAILNSLLTLINERLFYNNGKPIPAPLMSVIGSSNEYPEDGEGLEALFDRFLLRYEVDYIAEENNFVSMLKGQGQDQRMPNMTLEELQNLQFLCDMVAIPDDIFKTLSYVRTALKDEGIRPSDRRFKQSLSILQAKALMEQRQDVKISDILLLQHTLWEDAEQKTLVADIVQHHAMDVVSKSLQAVKADTKELLKTAKHENSTDHVLEATHKLKGMVQELNELKGKYPDRKDIDTAIQHIKDSQQQLTDMILEPIEAE